MHLWWLFLYLLAVQQANTIKFRLKFDRSDGAKCLFHRMALSEKYSLSVQSLTGQLFRIDIMNQVNNKWVEIVGKTSSTSSERFQKLATSEGVHMFCVSAINDLQLDVRIEIMVGLEMMNFENLPNLNDQENLDRELDWLEKQKGRLMEAVERIDGSKSVSQNLKDMMSTSLIWFAVLGLAAVVGINYMLYSQTKTTLKDRKLI